MKIAVMGAGAVGCYYGGMMARAGHEVTLIGRQAHVDAIRQNGLLMDTQTFQAHVPMAACTGPEGAAGAELVLFCVKSPDTEGAGASLAAHLAEGTLVLSLQNGVDNADRLQTVMPRQNVVATVVYVATEMAGPGHLKHHGRGELVIAESPASADVAAAMDQAGVPVQVSDNVTGALWAKLTLNCAYNALSALTQLPYGLLRQGQGVTEALRDVMDECLAVAQASGVTLPGDTWEAIERIAASMPGQYSSTAQDMARGRRSEIDHLNGLVVRQGEALGVPTPANRILHVLVRLLDDKLQTTRP